MKPSTLALDHAVVAQALSTDVPTFVASLACACMWAGRQVEREADVFVVFGLGVLIPQRFWHMPGGVGAVASERSPAFFAFATAFSALSSTTRLGEPTFRDLMSLLEVLQAPLEFVHGVAL